MNHNSVTSYCGHCERPSMVIVSGAHYCSSHGLEATLTKTSTRLVVDLRTRPVIELVSEPVRALAG